MLKHVSYRASNTSLGRPFGQSNCRVSQTSRTSLQPQQLSNGCETTPPGITSSAPNSPEMCNTRYHQRHHSITPVTSSTTHEEGNDTNRRSYTRKNSKIYYPHLQRTSTATYTHGFDLLEDDKTNFRYDSFTLKPDDPLSKHKKDLRSVDPSTLNGGDLLVNVPGGDCSDTISLHSSISFDTLSRNDFRASAMSLSNNCPSANKVPVRIHLRQLRPDIEYKTLKLDSSTTCRQLIEHLLHKLRLKHRDPNLFVVVLEAAVKGPAGGAPVKKTFLLEDSARPVELQQCRPFGEANFSINTRKGGVLRVKDSVLAPGSQYKSFLVSATSSVVEVIQLLLRCNNRSDDWRMFTLHEVCSDPYADRLLGDDEKPLTVQATWPKTMRQKYSLVLRRHLTQGLIENGTTWRRLSIDDCSIDVDAELDEHNSTCSSIMTNSSNSSRSRSSISSSTASVLSLASLSSNNSSRCSFSSGSSSGVSSGSSSYSPSDTPDKDRKNSVNMPKRILPLQHCTPKTFRKIDVEQNVQSYFTIPPEDEVDGSRIQHCHTSSKDEVNVTNNRPPHPLPRRVSTTPLYVNTASINLKTSRDEEHRCSNNNFRKSFSAIFSPSFSKIRDSSLRRDRSSTRSSRIRSATIASIEHMANLSLYTRSKSSESKHNSSTTTLTSQPTSPSTPTCSNSIFSFKTESPPFLSKSQSTSSINTPISPKFHLDHPVIVPSSTKLRPLSLAPNSCMAFPSRPQSLLSTQSQSTTTLRASSSSLCLVVSSPQKDTSSSFSNSSSGSSLLNSTTSSSATLDLSSSPSHFNSTLPDIPSDGKDLQKIVPKNESEPINSSKKSEVRIIAMKKKSVMTPVNNGFSGSQKNNANHEKTIKENVLPMEESPLLISEQRCQTTCQYNRCFYI